MEVMNRAQTYEIAEQAQVVLLGRITLGKTGPHQVESTTPDSELPALFEEARQKQVPVEVANSACCIDGRCALCMANDVKNLPAGTNLPESVIPIQVPVRAHVPGGTFHFATLMAIGANIPLVAKAKNFAEAKALVGNWLKDNEFVDAAHTTDTKLWAPDGTGCGAWDLVIPAIHDANVESDSYESNGTIGAIGKTMAGLYAYETPQEMLGKDALYREVRQNFVHAEKANVFGGYNSVENRNAMFKSDPENLEVLVGSHVEQGLAIGEIDGFTLDRDAMGGRLFPYDRWFTNKLALAMAGSPREQRRLLIAGDYAALAITNQLVAPGMPVGIIKKPV